MRHASGGKQLLLPPHLVGVDRAISGFIGFAEHPGLANTHVVPAAIFRDRV
jgi:hypothetical protein